MAITAADVMKLRKMTSAGMMDCKKALTEAEGDFNKAIEIIREKGKLVAAKRADRETTEGAVKEANRLNIPVFAMVDTCCDPTPIDYVIPANDDAAKSIECILNVLCAAIQEGLEEKKLAKDKEEAAEEAETKVTTKKLRSRKGAKPVDVEAEAAAAEEAPAAEAAAPAVEEAPAAEAPAENTEA